MKARDLMPRDVVTATPDTSLARGQRIMHNQGIRHLPVVSGTQLVGIVTDRDIRDATPSPATTLTRGEIAYQLHTTPVCTCMTRNVVTVQPDEDCQNIARMLLRHRFSCVPIVEKDKVVGIVSKTDCLRAFVASPPSQHGRD